MKDIIGHQIAVTEVVVGGDGHSVPQPALDEGLLQGGDPFVAVRRVVNGRMNRRPIPPAFRDVFAESLVGYHALSVDFCWNITSHSIFDPINRHLSLSSLQDSGSI